MELSRYAAQRRVGGGDQGRQSEYKRASGNERRFIKGQKYTLLAHRENLTLDGRQALKALLAANSG